MAVNLESRGLRFEYGDQLILEDISFTVEKGSLCAILGRNGSGKTTLVHCLSRILKLVSGDVFVQGTNLKSLSRNDIARKISLVPQEHVDIFPYRVLDVVVMGRAPFLKISAGPGKDDYLEASRALEQLNAGYLSQKNFNRISGGERRIVLLARVIAQAAPVMLLDEPTNHLDFNNQYHLLATLKNICRTSGISIIASMHDPNTASLFADTVVMLKDGKILGKGLSQKVMTTEMICRLYDTQTISMALEGKKNVFFPALMDERRS